LRVRQQIAQSMTVERMRVSERERVREQISRDYHDALGHKITKITLFSALAERNLESSDHPAVPYLRKVFEAAQDLSRETRGFIWMLNPSKDLLYEVASHLHDFGTNLFADTPVQVEVIGLSEPLRAIRVPVEWKRDVTLLFREALHNSLKHSSCGNVRLEFGLTCGPEYDASNGNGSMPGRSSGIARIELFDDGCGFGASPGSNGGNGLENMTRRARAIGGHLEIESTSTGTRIRLDCPIEEDPQNRGVWRPAHLVGPSLS
jgi:signal transduction histidine kinase